MEERLQKVLAAAGVASRREAEKVITAGRVRVNGKLVTELGTKVDPKKARITVDGKTIKLESKVYYLFNKPRGVVTTMSDPQGRRTVADFVQDSKERVFPVGRLDYNTEGLLLLTNDGELAHRLLSPKRHVVKTYLATVTGRLDEEDVTACREGIDLNDFVSMPAGLTILSAGEDESTAMVELKEGKFHQVKRMFLARGHEVTTLHRPSFGPLTLGDLPQSESRELTSDEIAALYACAGMTQNTKGGSHG